MILKNLTAGLTNYFSKLVTLATDQSSSYQYLIYGGIANANQFAPLQNFSVHVQLYSILTLGTAGFDTIYGSGMAYKIWEATKTIGGFFNANNELNGVSFGDNRGTYKIWSGELTWAAIIMCNITGHDYINNGNPNLGNSMISDAEQMMLKISTNMNPDDDGVWASGGLRQIDGSYINSNNRFYNTFTQAYVNPIGSTAATAWSTFRKYNYNPFIIGGGAGTSFMKDQCKS